MMIPHYVVHIGDIHKFITKYPYLFSTPVLTLIPTLVLFYPLSCQKPIFFHSTHIPLVLIFNALKNISIVYNEKLMHVILDNFLYHGHLMIFLFIMTWSYKNFWRRLNWQYKDHSHIHFPSIRLASTLGFLEYFHNNQ